MQSVRDCSPSIISACSHANFLQNKGSSTVKYVDALMCSGTNSVTIEWSKTVLRGRNGMSNIKVLLADDHRVVRQGVRALLEAETDMEIVGEVERGLAVAPAVERLHPDILVLDLIMPDMNGLEVARVVHERHPEVRIVVLSMHSHEAYVLQALRNGAYGYVLKDATPENLVTAIRRTLNGHSYLCPPLQQLVAKALLMNVWYA